MFVHVFVGWFYYEVTYVGILQNKVKLCKLKHLESEYPKTSEALIWPPSNLKVKYDMKYEYQYFTWYD